MKSLVLIGNPNQVAPNYKPVDGGYYVASYTFNGWIDTALDGAATYMRHEDDVVLNTVEAPERVKHRVNPHARRLSRLIR